MDGMQIQLLLKEINIFLMNICVWTSHEVYLFDYLLPEMKGVNSLA